jgi:hypothetical protein
MHESGSGPELTSRDVRYVVAIESKAEVTRTSTEDRLCKNPLAEEYEAVRTLFL